MRLLLIRHGDPDYERDSLTPAGQKEAELLADRLAGMSISEFYVSTMGRAVKTAEPALRRLGYRAVPCDWLREFSIPVLRPDRGGDYSHVPWDWLPQDWLSEPIFLDPVRWREHPVFRSAGVGDAYDAVIQAFDEFLAVHGYVREGLLYRTVTPNVDTIALFSHFGLSGVLLSHLMNCSPMLLWQGLCMAPSSVTVVNTEERRPGIAVFRTAAVGDISHLYAGDTPPSFAGRFCEIHGNGDRID